MSGGFKIALVGPLPPPSAGMANQTRQLARLLTEASLAVTVVQVNKPYRPAWIKRLPWVREAFRLVPYLRDLWRTAGQTHLIHVMANSGWAWHLIAAPAIWVAWLRGKPVVVNYRGGGAEAFFERQFRLVRPTLKRATAVTVPSGFLQAVFGKHGVSALVVPNVIDLSRFRPPERRVDGIHIVVGRNLEDIYDIPTAIRAFKEVFTAHPRARLSIAGSGPKRAELERLCAELGLSNPVTFTGRLENEQMAGLYQTADLMLNPSLVDNMPISLLEAMASGLPIVSTNVGGIPYLVQDGETALLVPPQDPTAMAGCALRLLGDSALSERLRTAGLAEARKYTWNSVRGQLFDVYMRALGVERLPFESDVSRLH